MAKSADDIMKIPGDERAAEARARIAAMSDAHLEGDHPLLNVPAARVEEAAEPEPKAKKLPAHKLTSPLKTTLPAEVAAGKPKLRPLPSKKRPIVSAIASFLLLLLVFKSEVIISQIKYWTGKPQAQVQSAPTTAKPAEVGPQSLIDIPKIKVHAPLIYTPTVQEAAVLKGLQGGVVHYATTPNPGQPGNSVFVGHSSNDWWQPGHYKFVFVLLDKLVVGDKFSINYQSHRYVYQVTNVKIVTPTDLSVLNSTSNDPYVTLITCTPPGTSWQRLVVKAKQISPLPQAAKIQLPTVTASSDILPGSAPDFLRQIGQFFGNIFSFFKHLF